VKSKNLFLCGIILIFVACATVPYTGRKQFNLMSARQENQLGEEAYAEVLKKNKLSSKQKYQALVKRVGQRIKAVADRSDFNWEFNVLDGKAVNAFALPGGKVAFWDGILPVCGDETGVAVVMGHEVAHALARHGAERMSQGMGASLLAKVLAAGLGGSDPQTRENVMKYFGLGAQVGVLLPFGRKQESEADQIGLILMAKAGYNPRDAVGFWQRMAKLKGGKSPPEFLSTHPSDERRISQIQQWLPEALQYYRP